MEKSSLGKKGESLAKEYLISQGHEVLKTNFRKKCGEIDIITRKGTTLYFIEVKNWRSTVSHPLESLTNKKCDRMKDVARIFLYELGWNEADFTISFSLLFVRNDSIDFYPDLF